jgi:hypothetical protein
LRSGQHRPLETLDVDLEQRDFLIPASATNRSSVMHLISTLLSLGRTNLLASDAFARAFSLTMKVAVPSRSDTANCWHSTSAPFLATFARSASKVEGAGSKATILRPGIARLATSEKRPRFAPMSRIALHRTHGS